MGQYGCFCLGRVVLKCQPTVAKVQGSDAGFSVLSDKQQTATFGPSDACNSGSNGDHGRSAARAERNDAVRRQMIESEGIRPGRKNHLSPMSLDRESKFALANLSIRKLAAKHAEDAISSSARSFEKRIKFTVNLFFLRKN